MSSSLPNGWSVRFSACPMYDRDKQDTEFGIAPDYPVSLTEEDMSKGRDTIIETARRLLLRMIFRASPDCHRIEHESTSNTKI